MRVYYLDDPLNEEDLEQLRQTVVEFGEAPAEFEQVRVPLVLPTPDPETGTYGLSAQTRERLISRCLEQAGLGRDTGRQVAWVVPQEMAWSAPSQMAIYQDTGYGPYVVQRWAMNDDGEIESRPTRVLNMHGFMSRS